MPNRRTSTRSRSRKTTNAQTVHQTISSRLVLLVDDDRELATLVKRTLEKDADVKAHVVHTGLDAVSVAAERLPDVVVLDLGLPDVDGTDVCRTLRGRSRTAHIPIVIVSERPTEQDRLTGFSLGADDYVTKPFSVAELQARVRVVLRRAQPAPARLNSYKGQHIKANFVDGVVTVDGTSLKLTRREFDLLWYLVEHQDQVIPADRLLEAVWGSTGEGTRTVTTHIARLRAKLGPTGHQIHTFLRKGYRFSETADS
jgi:DNA-binding response OmpR family regulator